MTSGANTKWDIVNGAQWDLAPPSTGYVNDILIARASSCFHPLQSRLFSCESIIETYLTSLTPRTIRLFQERKLKSIPGFFSAQSETMRIAATAALAAGEVIRDGYQKVHQIDSKGVGDLVSKVDFDADRVATDILCGAGEGLPIMSEELSPETEDCEQRMWVVDPLDGTTAYLMGAGPQFSSVLISLCDGGRPVLGLTYFPLTDDWFYAIKGEGAWKNGRLLSIELRDYQLRNSWVEMNQYGDAKFETDFFAAARRALRSSQGARIATSTFPYAGVAMRIAEQANGICAAIHDNNPLSLKQGPWDIAANQIIFEEAGGQFLNPELKPTSPFVAEPILVCPTKSLANEIMDCVYEYAGQ